MGPVESGSGLLLCLRRVSEVLLEATSGPGLDLEHEQNPPPDMFVLESAVHSCNVLRRLDELRRRDLLCDVTVVAEGRRFRAHRSVLASCSEFFSHRAQQGEVIALPEEVSAAGFEPLLKFAYTSRLLFSRDSVSDVKRSASCLGFHDVEDACFDFLRPKLAGTGLAPPLKKSCCKKKCKRRLSPEDRAGNPDGVSLQGKAVEPVADSPRRERAPPSCQSEEHQVESGRDPGSSSAAEARTGSVQSPQQGRSPSEDCEAQLSGHCSVAVRGRDGTEGWSGVESEERDSEEDFVQLEPDRFSEEPGADERSVQGQRSSTFKTQRSTVENLAMAGSNGPDGFGEQTPELLAAHRDERHPGLGEEPCRDPCGGGRAERGGVEREVAEHLATRLGSDLQEAGGCGGPAEGRTRAGVSSCPFLLQDRPSGFWKASEGEAASQSGVSSLTSGDDGDSEGESDAYARQRARQVQLPFAVDWIVGLSRNEFQQLLKQELLTREQQDLVQDMRRRSKNRLAAQRCRKRKLDCISNLQCEVEQLRSEREKLMVEKSQLSQMKLRTSALCERICEEAALKPEQLQVLAKYSAPDRPLFPHVDASLRATPPGCRARTPAEGAHASAETP
ncbi:transcription regulator protein BACH1b [Neosynchiropus ocellatus]